MADIFATQQTSVNGSMPQKLDNRSLVTNDIVGATASRRSYVPVDLAAGVRNGSPQRKNDSSVFSHLNDTYERDALKRKEVDISKPRIVSNNLGAGSKISASYGGPSDLYGAAQNELIGGPQSQEYDYLAQQIQIQNDQIAKQNQH